MSFFIPQSQPNFNSQATSTHPIPISSKSPSLIYPKTLTFSNSSHIYILKTIKLMSDKNTLLQDAIAEAKKLAEKIELLSNENTSKTLIPESVSDDQLKGIVQDIIEESLSTDETSETKKDLIVEMGEFDLANDDDYEIGDQEDLDDLPDLGGDLSGGLEDIKDGGEAIDMRDLGTGDEFLKVFKKINPSQVIRDGDGVTKFNDPENGGEYIITTEGTEQTKVKLLPVQKQQETIYEIQLESDIDDNTYDVVVENETIYEIELDEPLNEKATSAFQYKAPARGDGKSTKKRTKRVGSDGKGMKGVYSVTPPSVDRQSTKKRKTRARGKSHSPNTLNAGDNIFNKKAPRSSGKYGLSEDAKAKVEGVLRENRKLKSQVNKLETNIPNFENKLNEVSLTNKILSYSLKLISENVTTKVEKQNIVAGFDQVNTLQETQNLYNQWTQKLTGKEVNDINDLKTIKESVHTPSTVLTEDVAPTQGAANINRMKTLMNY